MLMQQNGRKTVMRNAKGQALVVSIVFLAIILVLGLALTNEILQTNRASREYGLYTKTRSIAEAGLEKALWCLEQSSGSSCGGTYGAGFSGESAVSFGGGIFSTTVTDTPGGKKDIMAIGYFPSVENYQKRVAIKVRVAISTEQINFRFGMQADVGGVKMEENSKINNGNLYSNGSVIGDSGAEVTGDIYVAGTGAETVLEEWLLGTDELRFGFNDGAEDIAQKFVPNESAIIGAVAIKLRKVSNPNDINVYIVRDKDGAPDTTKIGEGGAPASSVGATLSFVDVTLDTPAPVVENKPYWIVLDAAQSATKYYFAGFDAADGYTLGNAGLSDDWDGAPWTNALGDIQFKVYGGGTANIIDTITIGGDARASTFNNGTVGRDLKVKNSLNAATAGRDAFATTITNSTIGRDAYADTMTNTTVGGMSYPGEGVEEPERESLPITESMLDGWRADAESGGGIQGDLTITEDTDLGPKKITGNLTVEEGVTIAINGTIYVTGNIDIKNNVVMRLATEYGDGSGIILADGTIHTGENDNFDNSGQSGSYIMIVSAAVGGGHHDSAIDLHKSTDGMIFMAPYGKIYLHQNASAKQITGFFIHIENNATINYEVGLQNVTFSAGPGGTWAVEKGTWREMP